MATTNVQAFSGDVEVAKNLYVDSDTLFVDSVNNRVSIGSTSSDVTSGTFSVAGSSGLFTQLYNAGAAADNKRWFSHVSNTQYIKYIANDANTIGTNWLIVNRTGTTLNSVIFPAGNIGINTGSPTRRLEINSGYLSLGGYIDTYHTVGVVGGMVLGTKQSGGGHVPALYITDSGYIGINDGNPSSRLSMNPNTTSRKSPSTTGVQVYNGNTGDATCTLRVAGSTAGDPYVSYDVAGIFGWSTGVDNSDSRKFKIARGWDDLTYNTALTIQTNGHVGILDTAPANTLQVAGNSQVTGVTYLPSNYGTNSLGAGTGDGASYTVYNAHFRAWWSVGFRDYINSNTVKFLIDCRAGSIFGTGGSSFSSDDRLKINERRITSATSTLLRLDPQIYEKSDESSFLLDDNNHTYRTESGLIAQDMWYSTPELRHLVRLGLGASPDEKRPILDPDIRKDPDYSGWGPEPTAVNYQGLIPYLIKGFKEITKELPRVKTCISDIPYSNVTDYYGLVVSATTDELKNGEPKLTISRQAYDKLCFGVISGEQVDTIDSETLINTSGTGEIWIINTSNVEIGDYVTTSNVSGYAMKQDDDLLHNYTVAKIIQNCNFNPKNIPIKRKVQETKNVTCYARYEFNDIPNEEYLKHISPELITEVDDEFYYRYVECNENDDGCFKKFTPEITEEEYNALSEKEKEGYAVTFLRKQEMNKYDFAESKDEEHKNKFTKGTKKVKKIVARFEHSEFVPGTIQEVKQRIVDVLDDNGQIQWEDDPSGASEKAYKIRYLDANGNITDEANHVYKAALIGCVYQCG